MSSVSCFFFNKNVLTSNIQFLYHVKPILNVNKSQLSQKAFLKFSLFLLCDSFALIQPQRQKVLFCRAKCLYPFLMLAEISQLELVARKKHRTTRLVPSTRVLARTLRDMFGLEI
jgi:hypothetical protein